MVDWIAGQDWFIDFHGGRWGFGAILLGKNKLKVDVVFITFMLSLLRLIYNE